MRFHLAFVVILALSVAGCSQKNQYKIVYDPPNPPKHAQCAGAKVHIGMTREDVISLCGDPDHDNANDVEYQIGEQFVYGPTDYVYLRNGQVWALDYRATPSAGEAIP